MGSSGLHCLPRINAGLEVRLAAPPPANCLYGEDEGHTPPLLDLDFAVPEEEVEVEVEEADLAVAAAAAAGATYEVA